MTDLLYAAVAVALRPSERHGRHHRTTKEDEFRVSIDRANYQLRKNLRCSLSTHNGACLTGAVSVAIHHTTIAAADQHKRRQAS